MIKRLIKGVAVVLAMAVTMPIASGLKPYVLFAASGDVVINTPTSRMRVSGSMLELHLILMQMGFFLKKR